VTLEQQIFDFIVNTNTNKNYINYEEIAIETNELINKIKLKPKDVYSDLQLIRDEYFNNTDRCPKCGNKLKYKVHNESREYFGSNCYETINECYCVNCGAIH
jgi:uncharacterized protein with PIN domain